MEEYLEISDSGEELFEFIEIRVDPGQGSVRLDQFLAGKLPKLSRSRIQAAIQNELVLINNKLVKPSYKVSGNDVIRLSVPKLEDHGDIQKENIPLHIVYEDDSLMVIDKEPGMVVHPAAGINSGTLVNALAFYLNKDQTKEQIGLSNRYGLVHRIDKDTSGLLVVSKNDFVHAHLSKQFFDHTIEREYYALVWGEPDPPSGTVVANIGRDPKHRQRQYVFKEGLDGKHAVTHYELIESFYYTSLVKCRLETGRTHQIRVHMKYLGHPLFNDEKYGGDQIVKGTIFNKYKQFVANCFKVLPRMALHARSLGFVHPHTGKKLYFESELPAEFNNLLDKWRNYATSRKNDLKEE